MTTAHDPWTLDRLRGPARGSSTFLDLVQPHIGGGRASPSVLERIDAHPDVTAVRISGLDQPVFEALVLDYGSRLSAIDFWKCPRVADLTPLETLPNLSVVAFYWNQRTSRLWNFSRTPRLTGLQFEDFTRLHDLSDLATATGLDDLRFGDAVWNKSVFASLEPLASLDRLRHLNFNARRIDDERIQPLAALQRLETLQFPANLFTTRQVAWLRARLPDSLTSRAISALWHFHESPIGTGDRRRDILVVGKRKPWLDSQADEARIQRYVEAFDAEVAAFRADPTAQP